MIPAFVRRREPGPHLSYVAVPQTGAMVPEIPGHELAAMGAPNMVDRAPDPVRQSDFLGGRGRDVYPSRQDLTFTINPATMLGGEGASWEFEHFGYKVPMREPAGGDAGGSDGRQGSINEPLLGYPGMVAWPERANEYRPPWESFSSTVDQRTGADDSYLTG